MNWIGLRVPWNFHGELGSFSTCKPNHERAWQQESWRASAVREFRNLPSRISPPALTLLGRRPPPRPSLSFRTATSKCGDGSLFHLENGLPPSRPSLPPSLCASPHFLSPAFSFSRKARFRLSTPTDLATMSKRATGGSRWIVLR